MARVMRVRVTRKKISSRRIPILKAKVIKEEIKVSPISKLLKEKLDSVQGKGNLIVTAKDGRQVISSRFGKSMREMYLEEQGYDID